MSFDPTIGLGSIVTITILVLGGIGTWFTLRVRLDLLWSRSEATNGQHEENQKRMASIELQIARDCVKIDDFRRLEDRMTNRFEKVEHAVNSSAMQTVQAVKDALRILVPQRGRE